MPFSRLARHLGQQLKESPIDVPTAHLLEARRVAWAVQRASCFTPWKSNCFPQAIAAKYLLHRRGIASTLYLGAAFKMRSELTAHAWLRCGSLYVTGGAGRHHVETLGIFSLSRLLQVYRRKARQLWLLSPGWPIRFVHHPAKRGLVLFHPSRGDNFDEPFFSQLV